MAEPEITIDDTMNRVLADIEAREKSEAVQTPAAKDAQVEQQSTPAAPGATINEQPVVGDRPRGPDGKFIAKESAPEAAPAPTTDRAEPTVATDAPSTAQPVTPPVSWSADAKAAWNALPPAVQQAALKREQEVSSGFAQKSAELKEYEPLKSVIGPRQHVLSATYGSVANGIQTLFSLSDYAEKDAPGFIRWFAQQRGIDLSSLAGTAPAQAEVSADPTIAALQHKLSTLEQSLQQQEQSRAQAEQAELDRQIAAFAADPKYKHFESVRQQMGALMQGGLAKGLQDAYDQAVFANPTTRALVLQEQRDAEAAKASAENARRVAEAKRAAETNVATTGALGASPVKPKHWEETMEEKAKEISQRAA